MLLKLGTGGIKYSFEESVIYSADFLTLTANLCVLFHLVGHNICFQTVLVRLFFQSLPDKTSPF